MMAKSFKFSTLLLITAIIVSGVCLIKPIVSLAATKTEILFYYGHGCPHCAVVEKYFTDHNVAASFDLIKKEVYQNAANAAELTDLFSHYQVPTDQQGVPFALINNRYYVGDTPIIAAVEALTINQNQNTNANAPPTEPDPPVKNRLNFWVVTGAALVDAINPCEFAVLIILMATVLAASHRRRALWSGSLFSLAVYLSYLAMGFGLYSAVAAVGVSLWVQRIVAVLAIGLGLFNIKDAIWYGKGFLMEVPQSWRPRMKALIHSVTNPFSALLVGFVVSLFLLPCTSGPYIVIIGMLGQEATFTQAAGWLVYYNLIFILPMLAITLAVYFGLKPESLENIRQKKLRVIHAVAGVLLLTLGLYLLCW